MFLRCIELHECVILPDAYNGGHYNTSMQFIDHSLELHGVGHYNTSMQFKIPRENVLVY